MFEKGIDSKGKKLRSAFAVGGEFYAPFTEVIKKAKGQPIDRVTLKDSGDFYSSFNVRLINDGFEITAKTFKGDNDLLDVWGDDILGLTDENLQIIIEIAKHVTRNWLKNKLLAA